LWVLLVFDLAAAAMFVVVRHWGEALGFPREVIGNIYENPDLPR
jgi:hypothetical protein